MDRPPDVPPRPPEALNDLSQPSSSKSKIYHFGGVEVLPGVGVGHLGREEVAVGLDRRG